MVGHTCAFMNCANTSKSAPDCRFFRFPAKQKERALEWITLSGNPILFNLNRHELYTRHACSDHFRPEEMFPSGRLFRNALPKSWLTSLEEEEHAVNKGLPRKVASNIDSLNNADESTQNKGMDFGPWEGIADLSRCCRLCLTMPDRIELTEIFVGASDSSESLVHMIRSLIPIEVRLMDDLPHGVCRRCVEHLALMHSFTTTAVSVDTWLRNRIQMVVVKEEVNDSDPEIAPVAEQDPLALEQYMPEEHNEQEVWEEEAEEDGEPINNDEEDDMDDETYTGSLPKKKRGPTKKNPQQPAIWDKVKRKRGRPRGSTNAPKPAKKTAEESFGQVKFATKRSLTKHFKQVTCTNALGAKVAVQAPPEEEATDANLDSEERQQRLGNASRVDGAESLSKFSKDMEMLVKPSESISPSLVVVEPDDDRWQEEQVKESSDGDVKDTFGEDVNDPDTFTCAICDKTFTSHATIKRHLRYHNEMGRFKCDLCPLQFCHQKEQLEHYRTHTGDRPYTCNTCSKSFKLQTSLTGHERTHTGERPFTCTHCSKTFSLMCSLRNHARVHTGEKPFACKECPKLFATNTARTMHMRVHTGEKRFACNFCPMRFVESSKQKIHMRRIHTKECTIKCTACDEMFIDLEKRARHFASEHKDT